MRNRRGARGSGAAWAGDETADDTSTADVPAGRQLPSARNAVTPVARSRRALPADAGCDAGRRDRAGRAARAVDDASLTPVIAVVDAARGVI